MDIELGERATEHINLLFSVDNVKQLMMRERLSNSKHNMLYSVCNGTRVTRLQNCYLLSKIICCYRLLLFTDGCKMHLQHMLYWQVLQMGLEKSIFNILIIHIEINTFYIFIFILHFRSMVFTKHYILFPVSVDVLH